MQTMGEQELPDSGSPRATTRRRIGVLMAVACAIAGLLVQPAVAQAVPAPVCTFSLFGLSNPTTEIDLPQRNSVGLTKNCPAAAHFSLTVGFTSPTNSQGSGQLQFSESRQYSTYLLSVCPSKKPDLLPGRWTSKLSSATVTDSSGNPVSNVQWIPTTISVISDISVNIASTRSLDTVVVNGLFHEFRSSGGICGAYRAPGTAYLQRYLNGGWQNMIAIKHSGFASATIYRQPRVFEYRWVDVTPALTRASTVTFR
jgi:hypothetical protein